MEDESAPGRKKLGRHSASVRAELADTQPWKMHRWRYWFARLALAVLDVLIGAAIGAIVITAGGGLYLGITHRPLPSPIARMIGSHGTPAKASTTHGVTPTHTAAKNHHR